MARSAHVDEFARQRLPPREEWPELLFGIPAVRYPERLNCGTELLDAHVAAGFGERPAIITPERSITYAEFLREVDRYANVLREDLKLVPGNRVLIRGFNNVTTAALWFAVMKAGCLAVTTMPLLRAKELTDVATIAQVDA